MASFHAVADRSPVIAESGSLRLRRAQWESNFAEAARFVGPILDPEVEAEIQATALNWLARNEDVLEGRIRAGHVCDGHGDLQADDIFCLEDGVRICDCLEFSDSLRHGDVCADIAFLVMDLERLGDEHAAKRLIAAYEASAGTELPRTLLHHYVGLRAYVRAKVACLQHEQGTPGADDTARSLHRLAQRHLRRSRRMVVLVGGLPGAGKSTLAAGLSAMTGWTLLRSDELRRTTETTAEAGYSSKAVTSVYEELLHRAQGVLESGEGVILDASWVDATCRAAAVRLAADTKSELVQLSCTCTGEVADLRIQNRRDKGLDASEATSEIRELLARRADPWSAATVVDTSQRTAAESLALALSALAVRDSDVGT